MTHYPRVLVRLLVILGLVVPLLQACGAGFQVHSFGTGELWIGEQADVQRECANRGARFSQGQRILGCTDFQQRVVISTPDPKIIAHEWCHWSMWTDSHSTCPLPQF